MRLNFRPDFMALRWVLTTMSIFLMAYIVSFIVTKEDIPYADVLDEERQSKY